MRAATHATVFLLTFRQGGGGLEHKNSTLSTVSASSRNALARQVTPPASNGLWLEIGLLSHEYFHLFNVKRLRPVELGPFDFENPPKTSSLWISEGVTSYYSALLVERAGLRTPEEYLASLGAHIGQLQKAPGRLLQTVEQSSLEVWNNSNSGVSPSAATVSYYTKGEVLGFMLDATIRQATAGRKSFDDVMRLAYGRYAGRRGFTPLEFRATAEEVSGTDLKEWFRRSVSSTEELDYSEALAWYGLQFVTPDDPGGDWTLKQIDDSTALQRQHLAAWLRPAPASSFVPPRRRREAARTLTRCAPVSRLSARGRAPSGGRCAHSSGRARLRAEA